MLHNFPAYLHNLENKADYLNNELQQSQHYYPNNQPPYFCEMICFALVL